MSHSISIQDWFVYNNIEHDENRITLLLLYRCRMADNLRDTSLMCSLSLPRSLEAFPCPSSGLQQRHHLIGWLSLVAGHIIGAPVDNWNGLRCSSDSLYSVLPVTASRRTRRSLSRRAEARICRRNFAARLMPRLRVTAYSLWRRIATIYTTAIVIHTIGHLLTGASASAAECSNASCGRPETYRDSRFR